MKAIDQQLSRGLEVRVAPRQGFGAVRIEDQVVPVGAKALGLVPERPTGFVDDGVRAKLTHIPGLVACAHHADHVQVVQLAKLDERRAHPATGGMHENLHAGSDHHVLQQSMVCSEVDGQEASGRLEIQDLGLRPDKVRRGANVSGVAVEQ